MTTVASSVELAITLLTGTTGAEIRGFSLNEPLQPATVAEVGTALFEYKVVLMGDAGRRVLARSRGLGLGQRCGTAASLRKAS